MINLSIYKITFYKNGLQSIYFRSKVSSFDGTATLKFSVEAKDLENALRTIYVSSEKFSVKEIYIKHAVKPRRLSEETALIDLLKTLIGKKIEVYDGNELITGIMLGLERNMEILTSQGVNKMHTILLSTEKGIKILPLMNLKELFIPEKYREEIISYLKLEGDFVEIEIVLSGEGEEEIYWSYTTQGTGWEPLYRIFLGDNEAKLIAFSFVRNETPYDWDKITIEFSTATPTFELVIPIKTPRAPKQIRTLTAEKAMIPTEVVEADVREIGAIGIAVQNFFINGFNLGRGESKEVSLFSINVNAKEFSEWITYRELVHRKLVIENPSEINIISGMACIYLRDLFMGLIHLNDLVSGGIVELTLSYDNRIRVEKSQQLLKETTGIIRQGVKKAYETKFSLRNYSEDVVDLLIKDRPPEEILKPEIVNANIKPVEFKEGFYIWKIKLKPKQEMVINFNYVYKE